MSAKNGALWTAAHLHTRVDYLVMQVLLELVTRMLVQSHLFAKRTGDQEEVEQGAVVPR